MLVASSIKPQASVLATARGIGCVEVDYDALRGLGTHELKLF
jgi:RecB family endonuclease NucS